jgi:hypothetical protein
MARIIITPTSPKRVTTTGQNNSRVVTAPRDKTKVIITSGGIGPQGPAGAAGAGATWSREDDAFPETLGGVIAGTTIANGTNAIQILETLLYPYQVVDFANFSDGMGTNYELGETAGNATFNFTWTTTGLDSNWTDDSVQISSTEEGTILTGLDFDSSPTSYDHPAYRKTSVSSVTFTITGSQAEGGDASATTSLNWRHAAFSGRAGTDGSPATYTDGTDIDTFTKTHPFTTLNNWQPSATSVGSPTYFYFFYPSSLYSGTPTVTDITNVNTPISVPIEMGNTFDTQNTHGVTTEYKFFRTLNAFAGAVDFKVST